MPFAHLHVRSWFSLLRGGSSPEALAGRASALGMEALAITDRHGLYGAVRFARACRAQGVRPILGAEVRVEGGFLVLLAADAGGYASLCRLVTAAHVRSRPKPEATLAELDAHAGGLFCLTGTRGSRLWRHADAGRADEALAWVRALHAIFGERLSIEVSHHRRPGDTRRVGRLARLARASGVPLLATGDVCYAMPDDYRRYDLLTCVRHGITVFDPHPRRPRNSEAFLQSEDALRERIPYPEAFVRAAEVAAACRVNLLPEAITPPAARVPAATTPARYLRGLCSAAFSKRYPGGPAPNGAVRRRAATQLRKELRIIHELNLEEFFLVVHETVEEARRRGIRCAGRGSAANSLVAYLLGITGVDPLRHHLLFERFLHAGRRGTPDIDVDFDAERREEIIHWMEERFGPEQTAMTATVVTYRLRSAFRDVAKALGWPLEVVNRAAKLLPHRSAGYVVLHRHELERALGASPLLDRLVEMVASLEGCPRHLGLHVGGMVLSRKPLYHFSPVQVSANGVRMVQFDKDDVEALGLVKFDVLGLRMLAAVSEAAELIERHEGRALDVDALPLDDVRTFNLIRAGRTLGTFQIESQGQLHLLARNQPETFDDLIAEIALFRPGPVQGGMVNPFVRRRRGQEPVTYLHPDLEPALRDTYGILLFQEQVLEIAHRFAGMPLDEADEFRRLMSKFRDPAEMEGMRGCFVAGAVARGVPEAAAQEVFSKVANFVGYGFCRSHAAAFAKTVYQSAYLKCHHPSAFLAAVMQHRPGMYNLMTLEEEARRFGVQVLPPDVNRSWSRYELEHPGPRQGPRQGPQRRPAIRKPLTAVSGLSAEVARTLLFERLCRPFESVRDLYERVKLHRDVLGNLALSGALDTLAGDSRRALWELGLLERRLGPPGQRPARTLFDLPPFTEDDIPDLPPLTASERLSWDYRTHGAARVHPMTLVRRQLAELEVRPIETCYRFGRMVRTQAGHPAIVTVAGITMLRQRPPTAKGVLFVTIEDETGFIQCVVRPEVQALLDHVLRKASLIVQGRLSVAGNWRGLVVTQAWVLDGIFGGYEGHLSCAGGRDRWVLDSTSTSSVPAQDSPQAHDNRSSPRPD